ncbi:MAG: DUF1624 domain-containing protein [Bacteroidetes bacterium]|nr:DUF1624 domain-containing protein [Bacteroidota bacterium]MBS1973362.1 DUF1624 domain-containing protein [Bacteroidota bacterium]
MKQRYYSLDVFRGATVALMILVNNPGDWSHIYAPLEHAPWHGLTPTDCVFPFFLFAVGNAMAFVFSRPENAAHPAFLKKVIKRSLLIFLIGLFLNWFPFVKWSDGHLVFKHWVSPDDPETGIRVLGVLQRIALCYLFASLIVHYFKIKGAIAWSAVLLFGYWAMCFLLGDRASPYSMHGYFGLPVDKKILGIAHMYKGEGVPFDPEGITSTMPAIVQVIIGYFVGHYILLKGKSYEMVSGLFVAGSLLLLAGYCWDMAFPVNKKIWTISFVISTSGLAIIMLALFIYVIECKNSISVWSKFFIVFGRNPLFIFALSGLIPRLLGLIRIPVGADKAGSALYSSPLQWFYEHACMNVSENLKNGSLLFAMVNVGFYWALCFWLDKKKIYIKV